jgi:Listeria-Bacteroides repeat domain (List_Bact_rpt)
MAFKVTYNGNGSDGGSVPVDTTNYNAGDNVPVPPPGSMTKTGATFAYWNTQADGTGTFHGWPQDTSFAMPAANLTLFAQWFDSVGLSSGGATTHYQFSYDSSLRAGGLEPGRTQALMNAAEGDYTIMGNWFPGTTLGSAPINVYVTRLNGGANNTGDIRLKPNTTSPNELRCYLVSEITESFMHSQNKGWGFLPGAGATNENSCGEALSLFLTQQFALGRGFPSPYTGFTANTGNTWLNTSLPTSNSNSTRFYDKTTTAPGFDYGSRADYINSTRPYPGNGPGTGGSMLFIYYLYHQLGFSINQIIAAAPGYTDGVLNSTAPLRGVYKNLTNDDSDPFPFFKQLLDVAYPENLVSSIPGVNPDDPWPLASFQYWGVKNTFGKDEVTDLINSSAGLYANGFSLALDGFNRQVLGGATPATPTISFAGTTCRPSAPPTVVFQFADPKIPQRVQFNYDIHFDSSALGAFPATDETPEPGNASIFVLGQNFPTQTEFFFIAGADPYFSNVLPNPSDPSKQNVPWLSQDLRVFTVVPRAFPVAVPTSTYVAPPSHPVPPGAPTFSESRSYGDYDIGGAYAYITSLISYLNQNYGDPSKGDPFDINNSILPGQQDAYTGDSSVAPGTNVILTTLNNYNFAIARVRLRGTVGPPGAADGVKVFFRLWQTQTADTDWNPGYTYASDDPTGLDPQYPKAPADDHTIPFFATANYPVTNDAPNNQKITINQGDKQWAYFGCFLNLYDGGFAVNGQSVRGQFLQGTHHCLVAEIAFKNAPIRNVGGTVETADNSDKLAQRNMQVSTSANPGNIATHRIPQTFDIRRTDPTQMNSISSVPDELMISWGNTPPGSTADIYWPGANASEILDIASRIYGAQVLTQTDPHTIRCTTVQGVTYVPIPPGTGESLAGLLTIDLPANVVKGQEFNIVIRRIGTRPVHVTPPPPPPPPPPRIAIEHGAQASAASAKVPQIDNSVNEGKIVTERYVIGSFQVRIPVKSKGDMLPAEETTLAIFKARLKAMSTTNRWRPVLERYIGLLSARVDGLGGNATSIPPSFLGNEPGKPGKGDHGGDHGKHHHHHHEQCEEHTGKISGLLFDHFGDFEGFILETVEFERRYFSRETEIRTLAERVWSDRLRITVVSECECPENPRTIIIRRPPATFGD